MQHLLTIVAISIIIVFSALTAFSDDVKPDHISIDAPTTGGLAASG